MFSPIDTVCDYVVDLLQALVADADDPTVIRTLKRFQCNVDDIISDACDEFGFLTGEDEEPDDYDIEDEDDDGDSSFYNLEAEISQPPQVLSEADERKAARAAFRAKLGTN